MPAFLTPRPLTDDEIRRVDRLAHARTEPARTVERAQIVWRAHRGERVAAIARALGISAATVRLWLKRFETAGMAGLADAPRVGRPPIYSAAEVGEVVAASLTKPDDLGLEFGSWTLDRLTIYLQERKGIGIGRTRVGEILRAEGLRWRTQETWFGERPDPAFAEKRGPSSPSTKRRPTMVW